MSKCLRGSFSLIALGVFAAVSIGCGQLTIRTWVNVVEEESSGYLQIISPPGPPMPIERLQGGFLTVVQLDTRDLPGALEGTLTLEDVRIAGDNPALIRTLCNWNDPDGSSSGSVTIDVLGGESETDLFLDAKAQSWLSVALGMPPLDFEEPIDFELGSGFGLDAFMDALSTGTVDGMFASETELSTEVDMLGLQVAIVLNITVDNGPTPPLFDADLLAFCGPFFDQQGAGLYHGLNSKSSYLLAQFDKPTDPLVVSLADLGAEPGDTLRLTAVGTYADSTLLRDGNETRVAGVFSATDTVLSGKNKARIPDAIDAGQNYTTPHYWTCIGLLCLPFPSTDIPEDFRIDPQVDVVVPSGAQYLIMAPIDRDLEYEDNTGLGFGVDIEVNPGA